MEATHIERLYTEAGITYACAAKPEHIPAGMITIRYHWKHIETGRTGTHAIQVYKFQDLDTLLAYWNRCIKEWQYSSFPFATGG